MNKVILVITILTGFSFIAPAQKSKVIATFQLIETGKFEDAKKAIEEAVNDEKTSGWYRTWYARGLLCQTAYQEGMEKKDKDKYELYPDQLYVSIFSYEKARKLDKRGRYDAQLASKYILLSNEFQKLGKKQYQSRKYAESLKAFEQAIQINQNPILSVHTDTNLIYNAALAAYECEEWDKAISFLSELHADCYSSNATHLLYRAYLAKTDTSSAQRVLREGIEKFPENEELVLLLVDLLLPAGDTEEALSILDAASLKNPSMYIFPYTEGLVFQKTHRYSIAIEAYKQAFSLAPDETKICTNIGTCYYNMGVEIIENARTISNISTFQKEKARSARVFKNAIEWFEKALEEDPDNEYLLTKLQQLYKTLGIKGRENPKE